MQNYGLYCMLLIFVKWNCSNMAHSTGYLYPYIINFCRGRNVLFKIEKQLKQLCSHAVQMQCLNVLNVVISFISKCYPRKQNTNLSLCKANLTYRLVTFYGRYGQGFHLSPTIFNMILTCLLSLILTVNNNKLDQHVIKLQKVNINSEFIIPEIKLEQITIITKKD